MRGWPTTKLMSMFDASGGRHASTGRAMPAHARVPAQMCRKPHSDAGAMLRLLKYRYGRPASTSSCKCLHHLDMMPPLPSFRDGAAAKTCHNKFAQTPAGNVIFVDCSSTDAKDGALCAYNQHMGTCKDKACIPTGISQPLEPWKR